MKITPMICAGLLAFAQAAKAEVQCNAHGAVVSLQDGTLLYLGRNCDAARQGGGTCSWWNAASFLGVEINGQTYMVQEEIDCLPFCPLE